MASEVRHLMQESSAPAAPTAGLSDLDPRPAAPGPSASAEAGPPSPDLTGTAAGGPSGGTSATGCAGPAAPGAWKQILRRAVRDPDILIDRLGLPDDLRPGARRAATEFPLVVPEGFLARMRIGDPSDPLLRQVLPIDVECEAAPGFRTDPLGEASATRAPGLLHKYPGRVLLIVAGMCAVSCRYCFRRHFPYDEAPSDFRAWEPAFAALAADPSVEEVILSGGDPLMRSDPWLADLVRRLEAISHLRRLRIHTRLPILIPERVDDALLGWLTATRLSPWVVVHANHPAEIDAAVGAALERIVRAGVPVLNQSVLLAGVNDAPEVLAELSTRLLEHRVTPYYLHQLDPVTGAAHFQVPEARGREIVAALRRRLPGYGVPRYVKEVAGELHKREIGDAPVGEPSGRSSERADADGQ
ncbi:MAG: EF-P beta-lysylation protein EpmB [Planctomycetota bacterium]